MKMFIAALSLLAAGPVLAQAKPAAAPAVTPAARQAAAALVAQLGIKAQLQRQMAQTVTQMKSGAVIRSMLAQSPGFIQAYQADKAKFDPVLARAGAIQAEVAQGVINQNLDAVVADAVTAYATQFTVAELNGLAAFYRSPLGQSLQAKQPVVAGQIARATSTRIGQKIDEAMKANQNRLRDALKPLDSTPPPAAK
jgi:uncharacterized protein